MLFKDRHPLLPEESRTRHEQIEKLVRSIKRVKTRVFNCHHYGNELLTTEFKFKVNAVSILEGQMSAHFIKTKMENIEPMKLVFDLDETLVNSPIISKDKKFYVIRPGISRMMQYLRNSNFIQTYILSNGSQSHVECVHSTINELAETFHKQFIKGRGCPNSKKSLNDLRLNNHRHQCLILDDTYASWFTSAPSPNSEFPTDDCLIMSKRFVSAHYLGKLIERPPVYIIYGFQIKGKYADLVYEFCYCSSDTTQPSVETLECNCQQNPQLFHLVSFFERLESKYTAKRYNFPVYSHKWSPMILVSRLRRKILKGHCFFLWIEEKEIMSATRVLIFKMGGKIAEKLSDAGVIVVDHYDPKASLNDGLKRSPHLKLFNLKFVFDTYFNFCADWSNPDYQFVPETSLS